MKASHIEWILRDKIVVIVRGVAADKLVPLTQALYDGGIRLLEVTYDAKGETPAEETAAQIGELARRFDGKMLIGAGTVLTPEQVELTAKAGGKFIISPDTNVDVIRKTNELGLVSMPGALTPSEITEAHRAGADFVKVFPTDCLGSAYIKAVKAPLSHIRLLAVGGVSVDNLKEYMQAGVCGIGVASAILDRKSLAAGDFAAITALAKRYMEAMEAAQ